MRGHTRRFVFALTSSNANVRGRVSLIEDGVMSACVHVCGVGGLVWISVGCQSGLEQSPSQLLMLLVITSLSALPTSVNRGYGD